MRQQGQPFSSPIAKLSTWLFTAGGFWSPPEVTFAGSALPSCCALWAVALEEWGVGCPPPLEGTVAAKTS